MRTAPWYAGWHPVEFDLCHVDGCEHRHDDEDAEKMRLHDERIRKSERIQIAVEHGLPLATYGDLLSALGRFNRSAMLENPPPPLKVQQDLTRLLALYMENAEEAKLADDEALRAEAATGILFTMLEAERIGMAWWDGEEWQWR